MARNDLAGMRTRVRSAADMPSGDDFVPDLELNDFLNDSLEDLYEMVVERHENQFETSSTLAVVSGTSDYALPADLFKLTGVDLILSGTEYTSLRPFTNAERNRGGLHRERYGRTVLRYMLRGNVLRISPTPDAAYSGRLLYVPQFAPLTENSHTPPAGLLNGWVRWAILDAAIKCKLKQEDDVSQLVLEREKVERKIRASAKNRDANEPTFIADVRGMSPDRCDDEEWL